MKTILTLAAFALLCAFLWILFSEVPRADLGAVIGFTLLLAAWDLFFHDRVRFRREAKIAESAQDEVARDQGRPVEGGGR